MPAESAIAEPRAPLAGRYRFLRGVSRRSWLAWDERSDHRVLVTLVSPEEAERLRKARLLEETHLARVLDTQESVPPAELPGGCDVDRAAAVTELAHGRSLATIVQEDGPLTPARAVAWTLRMARSLTALHAAGCCHTAISPAAVVERAVGRPVSPVLTWLRALPYGPALSPEVLQGQEPTPADDVWSLCVTLYFAVTGEYPFTGDGSTELLAATRTPPTPIAELGVKEPALQQLFDVAFSSDANRRFRSAEDLAAALDAYELGQPLPTRGGFGGRPPRLGAGIGQARSLTAGLSRPGRSTKSLEGIVFDVAAVERPELRDVGPEPSRTSRSSVEPNRTSRSSVEPFRPSLPERPSVAQHRAPSLPPFNPFQRKSRWPALLLLLVGAAAGGAAFALRPTSSPSSSARPEVTPSVPHASKPTPAPPPKLTPAQRQRACTESYFEEGTFQPEASLEFVCQDGPLHLTARQLYELAEAKMDARLAQQAAEVAQAPPENVLQGDVRGTRVRRALGWYELLSTAIVRRSCCSPVPPVELPKTPGWCAQLDDVVEDLAEDSARSADLAPRVKRFDRAVDCLYANRTPIPYEDYGPRPLDDVQRAALQNFLSLAAMSEAKRRKLE